MMRSGGEGGRLACEKADFNLNSDLKGRGLNFRHQRWGWGKRRSSALRKEEQIRTVLLFLLVLIHISSGAQELQTQFSEQAQVRSNLSSNPVQIQNRILL